MAQINASYPALGSNIALPVSINGPNPLQIDGTSASFLFSVENTLDRNVSLTMSSDLSALGSGALANKIASVTWLKLNGSGVWAQAPSLTITSGSTVEMRADVTLTEPAVIGASGSLNILAVES